MTTERESMAFDVVIVGAGPAGLSAACRLMQQAQESSQELSVCVIEKGAEVGAHILSGAVLEPRALDELFPDWQERGAPLDTPVTDDQVFLFSSADKARRLPNRFLPKTMHNHGNYIVSAGQLCRWLAEQAEQLGVEIFPGFAASEVLYNPDGSVRGVLTGDMGVGADHQPKDNYMPGMELHGKYTLFTEGSRGHLGKQLDKQFELSADADPQHYGVGIKEIWQIPEEQHTPGLVIHGAGWPLNDDASGGFFLYHGDNNQVMVGLVVDLNYRNPYLSPFEEFQRLKQHPQLKQYLAGGERLSYGARALTKGGYNALPKMTMPGALLLGCDAGTLNAAKIKGLHTAMKSGMLAAESVFEAIKAGDKGGSELTGYTEAFKQSWLFDELYSSRNFGPALHRFGPLAGGMVNYLDQNWLGGRLPVTIRDRHIDAGQLKPASECQPVDYPKPDGVISFDLLSSVYLSGTSHDEDQPCHLQLADADLPVRENLPRFDEPAQRFCPAGVYEIVEDDNGSRLQINAANCLHCKTCDIKDPAQNITWMVPEGGGGPNYPNM